jgi:single-strand DNA-binding protein
MRVIVQGRLKQRSYETKEGEKRTVYEIEVDEVGPSLRNATAKVSKTNRTGAGSSGAASGASAGGNDDPWAASGSWGSSVGANDEPPF